MEYKDMNEHEKACIWAKWLADRINYKIKKTKTFI